MPAILAHGALGAFDELIFAAVGVAFVVMMAVSWLRSRNAPLDDEDAAVPAESDAGPQDADRYHLQ